MSERPYKKWFTILDGLEAEFRKAFPQRADHQSKVHGKIPADIGKQLARELSVIRGTLRNLEKREL